MDNLVLIRVTADLDAALRRAVLEEIGGEGVHRYRLSFRTVDGRATVLVSLRPELPWIGRPTLPRRAAFRRAEPFVAQCRKALTGSVVDSVGKPGSDRTIVLRFGNRHALVAELATHGANLVLLGPGDRILGAARSPRAARERLQVDAPYRGRPLPRGTLDPFASDAAGIERALQSSMADGESLPEAIRRRLFGIGTEGATQVAEESRATGRSPATVLTERLAALRAGDLDPAVVGSDDPMTLARRGRTAAERLQLLPWEPSGAGGGARRMGAAATAGLYHEAVELAAECVRGGQGYDGQEVLHTIP